MISSPTKRLLTEDERTSRIAPVIYGNDATSSDVTANIRSAAMRARKNVLEGYRTQPSAPNSTNNSPATYIPTPLRDERNYPPANDTLREVFATSGKYTPTSSPTKRRRSNADPGASSDVASDSESLVNHMDVERPMKPLRPSGRNLMAARALPRGLTSSPGGADMTCEQKCVVAPEHNADSIMNDFGPTSQVAPR